MNSPTVRLGCLPYLNVKPLVYSFEHGELPDGWSLVYEPPSKLAQMLLSGEIDVAPVSSFACLASSELSVVPGLCISSDGPVDTVLMLSKVPVHRVTSVARDTSSLSGQALLRIVLSENYGIEPELVPAAPDLDAMLAEHDAALLIGNPAMLCDKTGLHVTDLGAEWKKLTGLPAVFAVWAGPRNSVSSGLIAGLREAADYGMEFIPDICREQSAALGVSYEVCYEYLTKIMRYQLGPLEEKSLQMFGEKAAAHGLIEKCESVRIAEG